MVRPYLSKRNGGRKIEPLLFLTCQRKPEVFRKQNNKKVSFLVKVQVTNDFGFMTSPQLLIHATVTLDTRKRTCTHGIIVHMLL